MDADWNHILKLAAVCFIGVITYSAIKEIRSPHVPTVSRDGTCYTQVDGWGSKPIINIKRVRAEGCDTTDIIAAQVEKPEEVQAAARAVGCVIGSADAGTEQ